MNLNPFHFRQAHPCIVGTTPVSVDMEFVFLLYICLTVRQFRPSEKL